MMGHPIPEFAPELQALLDASPDAVLIVDRAGVMVAVNRQTASLFAATAEQLRGQAVETLVPVRLREAHAAARAAYAAAPTVRSMSARRGLVGLRADGTEFPVEISLIPVLGSAEGWVLAVVHDITGRARIDAELARAEKAAEVLDAIPDPILTTDAGGSVDLLNRSAELLTGWTRESAHGRALSEVLPLASESSGGPLVSSILGCLHGGLAISPLEAVLSTQPEGVVRALDVSAAPIRDPSGSITGAAIVARDMTHARLIARQLAHQATHDPLTGLVNRAEFEQRLARVLAGVAEEHAEHAVCFLDLDGFKAINDACGHLAGDEMLRQLSNMLRERMRARDTLARLGGDEFGILLEHCSLPKAVRIANEIRNAIAAFRFTFGSETYSVGASIGVVPVQADGRRVTDVLSAADTACYVAKRGGGNRVHAYDPRVQVAEAPGDQDWTHRVRGAIEEDRFRLYAQCIRPLGQGTGRAPCCELLLRLVESQGELLLPCAFLPAARRHGLMPKVDGWVIRHAIRQLADWHRAHPGADYPGVAVNLDDATVMEDDVVGLVGEELARSGVPPRALCFEISESVVNAHPGPSESLLRELRTMGCQTTLEHCGSGMAAFTMLRRLQLDYLKIAGHLVRGLARDPVDRALATAVNDVGHVIGLGTIGVEAEGPEVLARLRDLGVDYAQGLGFGGPEPFGDMLERLAAGPEPG